MKVVKILTVVVFVLLLIQGFGYLNLMISEKYETQPEGIVEVTPEIQEKVDKRAKELNKRKRNTKINAIVLFLVLVSLIIIWNKNSVKENIDTELEEQKE